MDKLQTIGRELTEFLDNLMEKYPEEINSYGLDTKRQNEEEFIVEIKISLAL